MVLGFLLIFGKLFVNTPEIRGVGYVLILLSLVTVIPLGIFPQNTDDTVIESSWTTEGPRMIFVTADWCLNCKAAYLTVDRVDVVMSMKEAGIDRVEVLDFTETPPEIRRLLIDLSGSPSVPLLWIMANGRETVLSGLWSTRQVLEALEPDA